jgi:GNAT superfamily N-acetyltransferase
VPELDYETRPAAPADEPFLRDLCFRAYRDIVQWQFGRWVKAEQEHWFQESLKAARFVIVEVNGVCVGTLGMAETAEQICLAELQILPEWQNAGIGTALLRREMARANRLDKPLSLRVLRENRARYLYLRHGFVITGETDTHYLMLKQPGTAVDGLSKVRSRAARFARFARFALACRLPARS